MFYIFKNKYKSELAYFFIKKRIFFIFFSEHSALRGCKSEKSIQHRDTSPSEVKFANLDGSIASYGWAAFFCT